MTSVSLPVSVAPYWRRRKREILGFNERFLRLAMRGRVRRGVTRRYNRAGEGFEIVCTRFWPGEYDALHFAAAALRVSVSSLVYLLIKLWLKPERRRHLPRFCANYSIVPVVWDSAAGILEESLTFWRLTDNLTDCELPWMQLTG
ncbi:hypothetical protein Turpa_3290 [Turneriella parva DSM 21527]|uniref:Uncharacterized protein n=1 Tax=Turneriella parva (strain ATCC BAA-1111 / DSM 21527 / NCTC 11395 / H) TaxID=869212 RepID=I4B9H2_TURPD|nr:hypothetical protein Turpa_3290 [Turneriella parva DSM 21527]